MDLYKITHALQIVKQIESENCKDVKHKSDAIGCYGLRPIALKEVGVSPLKFKYASIKLQDQIAHKYASKILSYAKYQSIDFLLYGWLNGPIAAKRQAEKYNYGIIPYRNPFKSHWYLKRYDKLNTKTNDLPVRF